MTLSEAPLHPAALASRPAPLSATRIFALAARRALIEDPVQSVLVPMLLLLPWSVLDGVLPEPSLEDLTPRLAVLWTCGALGSLLTTLLVSAMLRVRLAAAAYAQPLRPLEAYGRGLSRMLALLATEVARTLAVSAAAVFFLVPGIFLGFRLSVATESVVLEGNGMAASFQRSFQLTSRHFTRWLGMLAATVVMWILVLVPVTLLIMGLGALWMEISPSLFGALLIPILLAIGQYAWTYFFMELRAAAIAGAAPSPPSPPPPAHAPPPPAPAAVLAADAGPGFPSFPPLPPPSAPPAAGPDEGDAGGRIEGPLGP